MCLIKTDIQNVEKALRSPKKKKKEKRKKERKKEKETAHFKKKQSISVAFFPKAIYKWQVNTWEKSFYLGNTNNTKMG